MWPQEQTDELWDQMMKEFIHYTDKEFHFSNHKEEYLSDVLSDDTVKKCFIKLNPEKDTTAESSANDKDLYILDCEHDGKEEHGYTRWFSQIKQLAEEIVDGNLLKHALSLPDYTMELVSECSDFLDVYNINILLKEVAEKAMAANAEFDNDDAGYHIDLFTDGFLITYFIELKDVNEYEEEGEEMDQTPLVTSAAWICMRKPQE